jgi:hypothetical protein
LLALEFCLFFGFASALLLSPSRISGAYGLSSCLVGQCLPLDLPLIGIVACCLLTDPLACADLRTKRLQLVEEGLHSTKLQA